tara:strand:+ start:5235 stop:12227 length:6993 start_codon:yes stop_codon:yes gene_type:complete
MAEKKEFSDFQQYKCDILEPIDDIEYPNFCPTCTKDPSYVEPTWYSTDEPYLDKKNCLYKFNVTAIIDDLRLGANEKRLRTFAITFRNHSEEDRDYNRPEVQSKILRTAVYKMLIGLDKEVTYGNICSTINCEPSPGSFLSPDRLAQYEQILDKLKFLKESIINDISDGDVVEFIGLSESVDSDLNNVNSYFEYRLDLENEQEISAILSVTLEQYDALLEERNNLLSKSKKPIENFNPYGVENYAEIADKYFPANENPGNIIQFLVSVPAFVIDRIPESSTAGDDDDETEGLEDFVIKGRKLRRQLTVLSSAMFLYTQQYAIARNLDNVAMYYKDKGLKEYAFNEVRRQLKTFPADGKIDFDRSGNNVFFQLMKQALKSNRFRIDNFQVGFGKLVKDIKFKVDENSDEPFQIKKILVNSKECRYKKLKGAKANKLINLLNRHRFISKFLSKIDSIETELTANTTPEWQDFIPKHAYPDVVIQQAINKDGIEGSNERIALECLFEDAGIDSFGSGQIRNYLIEKSVGLAKLLAFTFNQSACFQASEAAEKNPTTTKFTSLFGPQAYQNNYDRFYQQEIDKIMSGESEVDISGTKYNRNEQVSDINTPSTLEDYARAISSKTNENYSTILEQLKVTVNERAEDRVEAQVEAAKAPGGNLGNITGYGGEQGNFFTGDSGHPLLIEAAELAKEKFKFEDTFLSSLLDYKRGEVFDYATDGKKDLAGLFSFFGICGYKSLIGGVLECLLGGVSFEQFVAKFIESQLKNLSIEQLGLFVEGLPPEEQAKVYAEVQRSLGTLVKPWEAGGGFAENTVNTAIGQTPLTFTKETEEERLDSIKNDTVIELETWNALSDEAKEQAEDAWGKPRVDVMNPSFTGDFTQTTIGTSVSNVAGTFVKAYTTAILNTLDYDILLDKVKDYPGAQLLKKVLFQFACMTPPLMHPPISEFLKSFSLQVCDPQIGLTIPMLTNLSLSNPWAIIKSKLKEIIINEIRDILIEALYSIIQKILELIDGLLCRALAGVGKFAGSYLQDAVTGDGSGMSFTTAMREAFCGPDVPEAKVNALSESLLEGLGYVPNNPDFANAEIITDNALTPAQRTMAMLSGLMSKDELLLAIASDYDDQDLTLLNTISRAIQATAPEMASLLGTPQQLSSLFSSISNFLSPDQRQQILDSLENPIPDTPLNDSLCLTNEEYDRWVESRRRLFDAYGFDNAPQIVSGQDDQLLDDLGDLLDAYTNPLDSINNGVSDLLVDPLCADGKGIIPRDTEETKEIVNRFSNDIFNNLRISIYRDLLGNKGYLNQLLTDEKGKPFRRHRFRTFFQRNYVNAEDENSTRRKSKGMFPETVAIHLKDQIESQNPKFNLSSGEERLEEKLQAGIRRKRELFASAINENRDEKYTNSNDKTKELGKKRIKVNLPAKKINNPTTVMSFTDNADDEPYKFNITYGDKRINNPDGEMWSETSITVQFGDEVGNSTIYRQQEFLPTEIINLYGSQVSSTSNPRLEYFKAFMNSKIQVGAPEAQNFNLLIKDNYEKLNQLFLQQLIPTVTKAPDGDIANGFVFGYKSETLTEDDLKYVDPEPGSTEYTYKNREHILGRSKTNNSRVVFLDPEEYGGRYTNPPFMIEPSNHGGWFGLAQSLIPQHNFCNKKEVDLIGFDYIKKQVNYYYNNLPSDPRLQQEQECINEPPFAKIANRQTKANLHGITAAIVRMYLSQAYLNAYPIFSNISFSSRNYSNVFYDFVTDLMEDSLSETPERDTNFIRTKIKKENYFLLFLEQAVESYQRLVDYKGVKPPKNVVNAMNTIKKVQAFYQSPDKSDVDKIKTDNNSEFKLDVSNNEFELITNKKYLKFYKHALAYQNWGDAIFESDNKIKLKYLHKTDRYLKYFKLVSKIFCIRLVKKQAMEILSEFTKYEADKLFKTLDRKINPKPPIHNIVPYLLQSDKICVTPNHKYGLRQPLVELKANGEADFGTVHDVQHDIFSANPMRGATQAEVDMINSKGRFIIERYIRVKDKEEIPVQVASRNENLFGVANMEKFQEYLGGLDQDKKISDYFGDLEFVYSTKVEFLVSKGYTLRSLYNLGLDKDIRALTPEVLETTLVVPASKLTFDLEELEPVSIVGSSGLSYGLRICYFLPDNFPANEFRVSNETAINNKAFNLIKVPEIKNSSFMVPLIETEIEIVDQVLSDVNFFEGPNSFDLYCMFREQENNPEFKFLFENVIQVKSFMSLYTLYSNFGFQASWGVGEEIDIDAQQDEEDDDDFDFDGDGDEYDFNFYSKGKKKARKLFVNFYNQNDFLDDENAGNDNIFEFMKLFNPFKFRLPFRLPWWKRRRKRDYRCPD